MSIAHLIGFARKVSVAPDIRMPDCPALPRRNAMLLFARALAFAAAASAAPRLAIADGSCGGETCVDCARPVYDGNGGYVGERCRSCGNDCGDTVC